MSAPYEIDMHELGKVGHPARRLRLQLAPREGEYINLGDWFVVRIAIHGGSPALTIWCEKVGNPLLPAGVVEG